MNWQSSNHFFGKVLSASKTPSSGSTLRILGICLLVSLFACQDKAALRQVLIEKTIKEKVASFKQKKITTCTKEALAEAIIIADSVMIQLALSQVDTSGRGNRPTKPARPELDLPVDTTPIKPLFEDSIIKIIDTFPNVEKSLLLPSQLDSIKKG